MTEEFRPMRRRRQELSCSECEAILLRGTYGVLAVLGDNDYPYGVPVNYVWLDGCICFHTALSGHKVDALRRHDKVSFTVVDKDDVVPTEYTTYFRSVIAFGRAEIIEDEEEKRKALAALGDRFYPHQDEALEKEMARGFNRLLMVRIRIAHLSGKEAIELVRMRPKGE